MIRWHHGHSLATGALLGLLVFRAGELWPLTIMFAFGLLVGRLWARLALLAAWSFSRFGSVVKRTPSHIPGVGTRSR